ncbi:hypothetical protein [Aeromicrobium sp. UC242_57]|uniref:hypothetical protein n=1 Tax=Aeromicrobium sp. UC242_57 TaxID=3374624 RepID=UPI0037B97568
MRRDSRAETVSPDDAAKAVTKVRGLLVDAQAMGDLDSLVKRLDALQPAIDKQREERKVERAAKVAEAQVEKTPASPRLPRSRCGHRLEVRRRQRAPSSTSGRRCPA